MIKEELLNFSPSKKLSDFDKLYQENEEKRKQ